MKPEVRRLKELAQAPLSPRTVQTATHSDEARTDEGRDKMNLKSDGGRGLVKQLADIILATNHFARGAGGLLYRYEDGVYRPHGDDHVRSCVKEILERENATKHWSSYRAGEVAKYIAIDAPPLWDRPPLALLNVRNGLLDVESKMLKPHAPNHLSPIQIPVDYDSEAVCPRWDNFVVEVFPSDCLSLAYELPAYLMLPDVSQQVAFLLIGEGSNGKSTYLTGIDNFLGQQNVVTVSLHQLERDKFATSRLVGILANLCSDIPSDHLTNTSTFKAIVGGDRLAAERKFCPSFEFTPFCRLVFSANHYPKSRDGSYALFRRWIVIPFERTFEGRELISKPVMDARLSSPQELSGLLNKALVARMTLQQRGGFTQSESTRVAWLEFREQTDPVATWLDTHTMTDSGANVTKKDLSIAYAAYCEDQALSKLTPKAFGQALKRLRPCVKEAQRVVLGDLQWVWLDLTLRTTEQGRSRDSRDYSQISTLESEEESENESNRESRVNPVNAVNQSSQTPLDLHGGMVIEDDA